MGILVLKLMEKQQVHLIRLKDVSTEILKKKSKKDTVELFIKNLEKQGV